MAVTTISPKYQVVIPKAVRDELGLMAGQKVQVMAYKDRIELILKAHEGLERIPARSGHNSPTGC